MPPGPAHSAAQVRLALRDLNAVDLDTGLAAYALALARVAPVVVVAPFFGAGAVPPPARIGMAAVLAAVLFPATLGAGDAGGHGALGGLLPVLLAKEALVGFALGWAASLLFRAAETAGRLVDTVRGSNLAEALAPDLGVRTSALGELYTRLAVVLFFVTGGHRVFLAALGESYRAVPAAALPSAASLGRLGGAAIEVSGRMLVAALGLAAPALAALFLADLALGLIARAAPHVPIHFVALPGRALLGIIAVLLSLGIVAELLVSGGLAGAVAHLLGALM
jgi:type III secretion protein SpaR/YscT/HrcT